MGNFENNINIIAKVTFLLPTLSRAEKKAADYLIRHTKQVLNLSLLEFAGRCACGQATIMRLCKKIGTSGYSELKLLLASQISSEVPSGSDTNIKQSTNMHDIIESIFEININTLRKTLDLVDAQEYEKAVSAITQADKVCFFAIGDALFPCYYANFRFRRIGISSFVDPDVDLQLINAANMRKGDVAIAISHSGNSSAVVEAMKTAAKNQATTICITKSGKSELIKHCDIKLFNTTYDTSIGKEIVARRIAEQAIIEALYMGILESSPAKTKEHLKKVSSAIKFNKLKD